MENMVIDLSAASLTELLSAKQTLQQAIEQRQNAEKKMALRQIKELAKQYNLNIQDALNDTKTIERQSVKPKYQHPEDARLVWTGRGRAPHWVNQLMQSGVDKESLRIPHE